MQNGAVDDTFDIQDVINTAAKIGDTIRLPRGEYTISKPLTWTNPDVHLQGEGGTILIAAPNFVGDAVVKIGQSSKGLNPTYRGGISDIAFDLTQTNNHDLIGLQLVQTWFTSVKNIRIFNPNGLSTPRQKAFQISAGALTGNDLFATWACNINVFNLQISGSFIDAISHVSGDAPLSIRAQVNGVNYFGGFAFGCGKGKKGTTGVNLESGDSTRIYGLALEDFETGCYAGTMNQGPLDIRMEDCAVPFKVAPGITLSTPVLQQIWR
jgi:hypothetical protein